MGADLTQSVCKRTVPVDSFSVACICLKPAIKYILAGQSCNHLQDGMRGPNRFLLIR